MMIQDHEYSRDLFKGIQDQLFLKEKTLIMNLPLFTGHPVYYISFFHSILNGENLESRTSLVYKKP